MGVGMCVKVCVGRWVGWDKKEMVKERLYAGR